ncbi:MAG: hypothetical protein WAN87_07260 [Thermoplasmata archaeon]
MVSKEMGHKLLPILLGSTMLFVILAAALTPNFGSVAAQSNCPYGNCTSGSGSSFPWISVFVALAVILAAIILALLVIYYRRRNPPPPQAAGPAGVGGAGGSGSPPPPSTGTIGIDEGVSSSPSYAEAARYFGITPAGTQAVQPDASSSWSGNPGYPEGRVNVGAELDSILAEIEQISGEILKRS